MSKWHVFEFMTRDVYCAHSETTLRELTRQLVERKVTGAPVVDRHNCLVGVVSLSDVAVAGVTIEGTAELTVGDIMQRHVVRIDQAATLATAVEYFQKYRVHRLIVTHDEHVCGVLSPIDLLSAIMERVGYSGIL